MHVSKICALLLLLISLNSYAQNPAPTPMQVLKAFRQASADENNDEKGNCASIAVIKAAISTFGPDKVFKSEKHEAGVYTLILRNGRSVQISDAEVSLAHKASGFELPKENNVVKGDQALMDRADFVFIVMAKNLSSLLKKSTSLEEAILLLNQGRNVYTVPALLGLNYAKVTRGEESSYVHANGYHAVFATAAYFDDYGKASDLHRILSGHNGILFWKDLRDINYKLIDVNP